jgi:hypothetical protein
VSVTRWLLIVGAAAAYIMYVAISLTWPAVPSLPLEVDLVSLAVLAVSAILSGVAGANERLARHLDDTVGHRLSRLADAPTVPLARPRLRVVGTAAVETVFQPTARAVDPNVIEMSERLLRRYAPGAGRGINSDDC